MEVLDPTHGRAGENCHARTHSHTGNVFELSRAIEQPQSSKSCSPLVPVISEQARTQRLLEEMKELHYLQREAEQQEARI